MAAAAGASEDGRVLFWDVESTQKLGEVDACSGPVSALDLSPSGEMLLTGGGDGLVRVWE